MAAKTTNTKREALKYINILLDSDLTKYDNLNNLFALIRNYEKHDFALSHNLNKIVKKQSAINAMNGCLKSFELNKKTYLYDAPYDFDSYLIYLEWDRDPDKRFYKPRRTKIKFLVDAMQQLEDDKLDLLTISMPPGTGKSTLGIFFLTWIIGKYPDACNLASAHGDKLTRSFFDGALSVITDEEYLWGDIFPGVILQATNSKEQTINLNKAKRFKSLTCRSIDGALTGATRCEKYLYADDLVSGIEEALNRDRLDVLWNKYTNDLKSRKKTGCKEIHIATRWSVHDVIGRLEIQHKDNPRAKFVVMPALDENGESNFDYDYSVGFDTDYFEDMRSSLDDPSWKALYMNEPIEREGLLFPHEELNYYNGVLPGGGEVEPDEIISFCDVAWGGGDYLSMPFGYIFGDDMYIPDVIFNKSDKTVTRPIVIGKMKRHKPHYTMFEANNGGHEYSDIVDKALKDAGYRLNITSRRAPNKQSKESRIIQVAPDIKRIFFLEPKKQHSEYREFMKNLTGFMNNGKNKHDDAPDSLAGLVNMRVKRYGFVKVMERPF